MIHRVALNEKIGDYRIGYQSAGASQAQRFVVGLEQAEFDVLLDRLRKDVFNTSAVRN